MNMYIFNGRLKSDFTVGIAKSIHVQTPQMLKNHIIYTFVKIHNLNDLYLGSQYIDKQKLINFIINESKLQNPRTS